MLYQDVYDVEPKRLQFEYLDTVMVDIKKVKEIANTDYDYLQKLDVITKKGKRPVLILAYFRGATSVQIFHDDALTCGYSRVPIDALTLVKKWDK